MNSSGEVDQERSARAMADPEIQQILADPMVSAPCESVASYFDPNQVRQALQDMQHDPAAAQTVLGDKVMAAKIEKLIAAGVLQIK